MMILYEMIRSYWMPLMLFQLVPILDQLILVNLNVIDLCSIDRPGSQ